MKKIAKKLIFDLIMAMLWITLMIYSLTGAYWHEVLGLLILVLFGIHLIYNMKKMKREIPRMFRPGKRAMTQRYVVDFALLFFGFFTGISGVLISKEILTGIAAANIPLWTLLHVWSSYITLALIAGHVGQHLNVIIAVLSKPFKHHPAFGRTAKSIWNLVIVGVVLYGFVANANVDYASGVPVPSTTNQSETQESASELPQTNTADTVPTLSEFLSGLICTACHRNCPLTAPQCGRGDAQVQTAEEEYTELYGSVSEIQITVGGTSYTSSPCA